MWNRVKCLPDVEIYDVEVAELPSTDSDSKQMSSSVDHRITSSEYNLYPLCDTRQNLIRSQSSDLQLKLAILKTVDCLSVEFKERYVNGCYTMLTSAS